MSETGNSDFLKSFLHFASETLEFFGVSVILVGVFIASFYFIWSWFKTREFQPAFAEYRLFIARGILLGLELLVAADIIGTVLVSPTMQNVLVLGLIVLIRTFLSYSLEIEIHGKLPWRHAKKND